MKKTLPVFAAILSCIFIPAAALGQTLRQPLSVLPASSMEAASLTYNYYYSDEDEEASPSDAKAVLKKPTQPQQTVFDEGPAYAGCADCGSIDPSCGCDVGGCDDPCVGCASGCASCYLFGSATPWKVIGKTNFLDIEVGFWTQIGYHTQGANGWGTGLMNSFPNQVQLQQQWGYIQRVADNGGVGLDWGFRMDYVYGTDGPDTQAYGGRPNDWDNSWNNGFDPRYGYTYGQAIPQLYGEVAINKWTAKFGHAYTLHGYESVMAPNNFFYSHTASFYSIEPFTMTGATLAYELNDNVTLTGGWTQGWDTGFTRNGGSSLVLAADLQLTRKLAFSYAATIGDFGYDSPFGAGSDSNGYAHSLLLTYDLTNRWKYVIESDFMDNDRWLGSTKDAIGISQYLMYELNDCWAIGARYEWFKFGALRGTTEYNSLTLGVNYRPMSNVVIRPEIRWNDYDNVLPLRDTSLLGIDAVITY